MKVRARREKEGTTEGGEMGCGGPQSSLPARKPVLQRERRLREAQPPAKFLTEQGQVGPGVGT